MGGARATSESVTVGVKAAEVYGSIMKAVVEGQNWATTLRDGGDDSVPASLRHCTMTRPWSSKSIMKRE